jgi:hypothetical protein
MLHQVVTQNWSNWYVETGKCFERPLFDAFGGLCVLIEFAKAFRQIPVVATSLERFKTLQ